MFNRIDRIFAITGTLTFVLGWTATIYLAIDWDYVGHSWVADTLLYGMYVMVATSAQWVVAVYAHSQIQRNSN